MSESYIGWVIPKWFLKRWTSMALLSNVPEKHWKATWLTFMHCFQILNNFLNIKVYAFWDFFFPPKFSGLSVDLWKDSCSWMFETCSQRFSDRPGFLSVSRRGQDDGILGPHSYSPAMWSWAHSLPNLNSLQTQKGKWTLPTSPDRGGPDGTM